MGFFVVVVINKFLQNFECTSLFSVVNKVRKYCVSVGRVFDVSQHMQSLEKQRLH